MIDPSTEAWRRCSTCKKPIPYGHRYWVCNVSTCNQKRTGLVFCSVSCWDAHVPVLRHKNAWAEERFAPKSEGAPLIRRSRSPAGTREVEPRSRPAPATERGADEILVVASKVKAYIKQRSGMSTAAGVHAALSHRVRQWCDRAIREAEKAERKTVMERDVP